MAEELLVGCRLRQCLVQTHVVGEESSQLVLLILRHDARMYDILARTMLWTECQSIASRVEKAFIVRVAIQTKSSGSGRSGKYGRRCERCVERCGSCVRQRRCRMKERRSRLRCGH